MALIQFYHLTTTPLEVALPKIMEKALATGERVLVLVGDEQSMDKLNDAFWTYNDRSFLPHGSSKNAYPEEQPIYITYAPENPNKASILAVTDGSQLEELSDFSRVLDVFNGHDDAAVTAARTRWKTYKDAGHELKYFQQNEQGGWKQAA